MTATLFSHVSVTTQATACKICQESIPPKVRVGNLETDVCDSMECRSVIAAEKSMAPANYALFLQQQSALIQKKKRLVREEQERLAAADEKETRDSALLLARLQETQPAIGNKIPVFNIPTGKSKLVPLGEERKSAYREHLKEVINEAFQEQPIIDYFQQESIEKAMKVEAVLAANPDVAKLTAACCSLCKGGCCSAGADTGLISLETVKRAVKIYKFTSEEEVLNSYMSMLDDLSADQSCINQGPEGCVLPKEMRSDICNGYYCEPLKELQQDREPLSETSGEELASALIIQRGYDRWSKYDEQIDREIVSCTHYENEVLTSLPLPN